MSPSSSLFSNTNTLNRPRGERPTRNRRLPTPLLKSRCCHACRWDSHQKGMRTSNQQLARFQFTDSALLVGALSLHPLHPNSQAATDQVLNETCPEHPEENGTQLFARTWRSSQGVALRASPHPSLAGWRARRRHPPSMSQWKKSWIFLPDTQNQNQNQTRVNLGVLGTVDMLLSLFF